MKKKIFRLVSVVIAMVVIVGCGQKEYEDYKIYSNMIAHGKDVIAQFQQASSQLEGATPFLMNADVTFKKKYEENELTTSLVFNYFSDRVYSIGTRGFENIIEKGIPTLDLVSSLKLGEK